MTWNISQLLINTAQQLQLVCDRFPTLWVVGRGGKVVESHRSSLTPSNQSYLSRLGRNKGDSSLYSKDLLAWSKKVLFNKCAKVTLRNTLFEIYWSCNGTFLAIQMISRNWWFISDSNYSKIKKCCEMNFILKLINRFIIL